MCLVFFFSSHQWPWGGGRCCHRTQERIRDWGGPLQMLRLWLPVDWQVEPSQSINCQKVILHSEFIYRDSRASAAKKWSSIQSSWTETAEPTLPKSDPPFRVYVLMWYWLIFRAGITIATIGWIVCSSCALISDLTELIMGFICGH